MVLLGVLASTVLSLLATRSYTATASLYFSVRHGDTVNDLQQGAQFTRDQMQSYAGLVTTPSVLGPVARDLDVPGGAAALADEVSVRAPAGTVMLDISVTDPDPRRAARIADAVAAGVIREVASLSPKSTATGQPGVVSSVVRPAAVPAAPSSPRTTMNVAAGAVLGLIVGLLAALAREALDSRLRTAADVATVTERPVIGALGVDDARSRRVVVAAAPHSPLAESYRQLRTNLQFLGVGNRSDDDATSVVLAVSSAVAGEGKSTVSANLAVALAETGASVLLVDADLRRPSVAGLLGIEGGVGLTSVLVGHAELADAVQDWGTSGLRVLAAGPVPPNPAELLGSPAMHGLLARARRGFDYVVIDTAPLLPVTDAAVLSRLVDGIILVARAGEIRRGQLAEALTNLDPVSARVLGVVLNRTSRSESAYEYRYGQRSPSGAPRGSVPAARRNPDQEPHAAERPLSVG